MDEKTRLLLFEAAGLLSLIRRNIFPPKLQQQAAELLDKIGAALTANETEMLK